MVYMLNLDNQEFHKSLGSNKDRFEEVHKVKKYFRAIATDSFGKKFYSKPLRIRTLLNMYYSKEHKLVNKNYWQAHYSLISEFGEINKDIS